jgi:hypothetical protein
MTPPILVILLGAGLASITFLPGALVALFGAADLMGRLRDYNYLERFDYIPERMARFYGRSLCGRYVVTSLDPAWRWYYHRVGYRWYHILPDGFPHILMYRRFWTTLYKGHRA